MIKKETSQMSFYSHIYDEVIPQDHLLKRLAGFVDFKYVNEVCDGLSCVDLPVPPQQTGNAQAEQHKDLSAICTGRNKLRSAFAGQNLMKTNRVTPGKG